jgi:hypothetical protein
MSFLWFVAGFIVGFGAGALAVFFYIKYAMKKVMQSFESLDVIMKFLEKRKEEK